MFHKNKKKLLVDRKVPSKIKYNHGINKFIKRFMINKGNICIQKDIMFHFVNEFIFEQPKRKEEKRHSKTSHDWLFCLMTAVIDIEIFYSRILIIF